MRGKAANTHTPAQESRVLGQKGDVRETRNTRVTSGDTTTQPNNAPVAGELTTTPARSYYNLHIPNHKSYKTKQLRVTNPEQPNRRVQTWSRRLRD